MISTKVLRICGALVFWGEFSHSHAGETKRKSSSQMGGSRKTSSKTQNPCIAKMMRGFLACLQGGKKTMRHKDVVRIGCGAGFAGDRPAAALRLLQKVPDMHYLVLECLAERTLAVRYQTMVAGGKGFDPRSKSPPLPHLSHCLLHRPEPKVLKFYPEAIVVLVCLHITKSCKSSQFLMERFVNL